VQDTVDDFLGVKLSRNRNDYTIEITQPHLINSILVDLKLDEKSITRQLPALIDTILNQDLHGLPHSEPWHYCSVIGKLNYLEKSNRPDIAYAVHQCASFSKRPTEAQIKAVKLIGRYLQGTRTKGLQCTPKNESMLC
jgi:hypothetical protein